MTPPSPHPRPPAAPGRRWRARTVSAMAVRVFIVAVPLVVGVATATVANMVVPRPAGGWPMILWWVGALAASAITVGVVLRQVERLLPLVVLLRLSLAFPDHTPSRARVALRAGSLRHLEARIAALRAAGDAGETDVGKAAETVVMLAAGLTVHDRKTRGHSERVRALSELIAEQLHVPHQELDHLRWASLLHDCGKVMVDPRILNKTGSLDKDEWEVIRRHPEEGARIAAPLREWLGDWTLAIEQHHERWNGMGYPKGLAGTEISQAARIVAVADSYDAMTSVRTYQAAMSPAAARAEITAKAGIDFDPHVVRAFLLVAPGRLNRVLGPLSWLAQIPLAGGGVASAANASARRAQSVAAVAGGSGALMAAAAVGLVGPVATTAAASRPVAAVAAPAPPPVVRFVPAAATPAPTTSPPDAPQPPAPTPAQASVPRHVAAATAIPVAFHAAPAAPPPGGPAPVAPTPPARPPKQPPPETTPPPPPGTRPTDAPLVNVEVHVPPGQVDASVEAVPGACVAVTSGALGSRQVGCP